MKRFVFASYIGMLALIPVSEAKIGQQLKSFTKTTTGRVVSVIAAGSLLASAYGLSRHYSLHEYILPHRHARAHIREHKDLGLEIEKGGVVWHAHRIHFRLGGGRGDEVWGVSSFNHYLKQYLNNKNHLLASDYDRAMVLYVDNDGDYNYGLASVDGDKEGLELLPDEIAVLASAFQRSLDAPSSISINLKQILGVYALHHPLAGKEVTTMGYDIVRTFPDSFSIQDRTIQDTTKVYGKVTIVFSNGWVLMKVTAFETEGGNSVEFDSIPLMAIIGTGGVTP